MIMPSTYPVRVPGVPRTSQALLALLALILLVGPALGAAPIQPNTAYPVVTDADSIPTGPPMMFGPASTLQFDAGGTVYFTSGQNTALFKRTAGGASPARVLQAGDPFPGISQSTIGGVALAPTANPSGTILVNVSHSTLGSPSVSGLYLYNGSTFTPVALVGSVHGTCTLLSVSNGYAISDGKAAFVGGCILPGGDEVTGIFLATPSGSGYSVAVVALEGTSAPSGGTYADLSLFGLTSGGEVAFFSYVRTLASVAYTLFLGTPGSVARIVGAGDSCGAFVPGGVFNVFSGSAAAYAADSPAGKIAFLAECKVDTGSYPIYYKGIWIGTKSDTTATLEKVILSGDPADGLPGYNYDFSLPAVWGFNASGDVLFRAYVRLAADTFTTHAVMTMKRLGSPPVATVLAQTGDAGPGGSTLFAFDRAVFNDHSKAAFVAQHGASESGPMTGYAVYYWDGSATQVIGKDGDTFSAGGASGTLGLRVSAASTLMIGIGDDVGFSADVIGTNDVALLRWKSGRGIAAVATTADNLPAGARKVVRAVSNRGGANEESLLFAVFYAGGPAAFHTRSLTKNSKTVFKRIFGEGDQVPGTPGANLGKTWAISYAQMNEPGDCLFSAGRIVGPSGALLALVRYNAYTGITTIAYPGQTVLDYTITGVQTPPALNNAGQVAFVAGLRSSTGSSISAVLLYTPSTGLGMLVSSLDDLPLYTGTAKPLSFSSVALNDAGKVAFQAYMPGPSPPTAVLDIYVVAAGSSAKKVVVAGDLVSGGTFKTSTGPIFISDSGEVAYLAALSDGTSTEGVFAGVAEGAQIAIALNNTPAPHAGGNFTGFEAGQLSLNSSGQIAFWARLSGSVRSGFFLGGTGTLLAARLLHGDRLPGGGVAGPMLHSAHNFVLSDNGDMAILATLQATPTAAQLITIEKNGQVRGFAKEGSPAAVTGGTFGRILPTLAKGSKGTFFLNTTLAGGTATSGIFWNGKKL
jgi:hypothetical protein